MKEELSDMGEFYDHSPKLEDDFSSTTPEWVDSARAFFECDEYDVEARIGYVETLLLNQKQEMRKLLNELPREKDLPNRSYKEGWNACRQSILKRLSALELD